LGLIGHKQENGSDNREYDSAEKDQTQSDTIRYMQHPQTVDPRASRRALATVMNNAG
jgi:hypothetical protein